jgi:hypothetical protein
MMDWNEDDFLEKLAPQLRREGAAERGPCPDAETLCAVTAGEAQEPLRTTVAKHIAQCPSCADLQRRLASFDQEGPPEPEAAWKETRNRLDHWLESLLRSQAASLRTAKTAKPSGGVLSWQGISTRFSPWKSEWALGVAVALILIVGTISLLKLRHAHHAPMEVATRPSVSPEQPPYAAPAEEPGKKGGPASPAAPAEHHQPVQTAHGIAPSLPNSLAAPTPTRRGATVAPPAQSEALESEAHPSSTPASPSPAPAAPADRLSSLRLEPGARLLIVLKSIHRQPDGSYAYQAILLLPLAQPGLVTLDRGTEVNGTVTVSHGHTSVTVTELVAQGTRYTLKDGDGSMNAQTPGTEGEVHFDRSQVLEMWSAFVATYEQAPGRTAPPEPQK